MRAVLPFCKLSVTIWLKLSDLGTFILCRRTVFHIIFERTTAMPQQCFRQDQPALGLRENTGIFLCSLIINHCQSSLKCMCVERRIHKDSTIGGIQTFIHLLHGFLCLRLCCKPTDYTPALRIQPQVSLFCRLAADHFALFRISTCKAILIPAILIDQFTKLCHFLLCIRFVFLILFQLRKFLHVVQCIVKLQCHKS